MTDQPPRASVATNTVAHFVGRGWTVVMNLCFVPIYLRLLGPEAYGLVAFSATLNSLFSLLDLGLTTTINRELARISVDPSTRSEARTIVRTMEAIYWPIGILIACTVLASSDLISRHWLNAHSLEPTVVRRAVQLVGLQLALLWPYSLYEGGLLGLERQVVVNILSAAGATIRAVGAIVALKFVAPTILVFVGWQIIANGLLTLSVAVLLWMRLPPGGLTKVIDLRVLRRIRTFTLGVMGISLVSLILTQMDKVILSKMLSLEHFGYYMLATGVAASITNCASPFFLALMPRFVRLWSAGDEKTLGALYHQASQALSVVVVPVGLAVSLFATDIVRAWTGDALIAQRVAPIVSLLVIGHMINSMMVLPYALQLAAGWTRLAYYQNVVSIVLLAPFLVLFTKLYQGVGAAIVWVMLNVGYLVFSVPLTHRRILRGQQHRWYLDDLGRPLAIAVVVLLGTKLLTMYIGSVGWHLILVALGWLATVFICARTLPDVAALVARVTRIFTGVSQMQKR